MHRDGQGALGHGQGMGHSPLTVWYCAPGECSVSVRGALPSPCASAQVFGMGLRPGFTHFTWFLTVLSLLNVCASAMCITISTICPTFGLAALVSTLYLLFLMAFGGVYIRMDSMPESLHWLRYVSFFSSAFELLMVNEINGRTVLFNPVDANGQHQYSVPQTGRTFLYNMGLVPTEAQWKLDMLLLLLLTALYVLLAGLFLHFGNQERR